MNVDNQLPSESKQSRMGSSTMDVEAYESYTGLARLHRLIYIADHHPGLRMSALKIAIEYVINSHDLVMYELLHKKVANGNAGLPDATQSNVQDMPIYDPMWVATHTEAAAQKLEQLDNELKNYASNSIKEGIRSSHNDLGDHYFSFGDLPNSLKCYLRGLDYCTSSNDIVDMCLNVIKVSIFLETWSNVSVYVAKAVATPNLSERNSNDVNRVNQLTFTKLKCAGGLAYLALKDYKAAAKLFVQASFKHCEFPDMISPKNVAMYGGLCALATFDHQEMKKNVIESSVFKLFLGLEPKLLDVIQNFCDSQFEPCRSYLHEIRDNLLLDMYMAPHVHTLFAMIQNRTETPFEGANTEPVKIRLFIVGSNYTALYGSVRLSSLDTVRKLKQRIEQLVPIPAKIQSLMHRGVHLMDTDIIELVGIKGYDTIILGTIPHRKETHDEPMMPPTSGNSSRKRTHDNEEEESLVPTPVQRSRYANEPSSSPESSSITGGGSSTESTGPSTGFSELDE